MILHSNQKPFHEFFNHQENFRLHSHRLHPYSDLSMVRLGAVPQPGQCAGRNDAGTSCAASHKIMADAARQ